MSVKLSTRSGQPATIPKDIAERAFAAKRHVSWDFDCLDFFISPFFEPEVSDCNQITVAEFRHGVLVSRFPCIIVPPVGASSEIPR